MQQSLTLRDLMTEHWRRRIDLSPRTLQQYELAVNALEKWTKGPVPIGSLCDDLILEWLGHLKYSGLAARTINGHRMGVLVLWREAARRGLITGPVCIPRLKIPKRIATSWSVADVSRILAHCSAGQPDRWTRSKRHWSARHWQALVLTIYDTSLRLSCLLNLPRPCVDVERRCLIVPGELTKSGRDEFHRLHPQTCGIISLLPPSDKLFPWPKHKRGIWRDFRRVLFAAGLPCTYRDLFHRLRRTSYTLTYKHLGPAAASDHAGHQSDLSEFYLDRSALDLPNPIDVLPRPQL